MSGKVRWIFGALLLLSLLTATGLAVASTLASTTYLPAVYKQPTPTATPTPEAKVAIVHIEADPSGPDLESEYVAIKNQTSSTVNMTGWTLKDKTDKSFKFPTYNLAAGKTVNVWSRAKTPDDPNTGYDLYWGLTSPTGGIWDNLSDCGYLYDKDGDQVDEYCYDRPK